MGLHFEKYAQEGNYFLNSLAKDFGHPEEVGRTGILLRAILHTFRDRITISQSFHFMSQLPMFLKAIYVDNWKYHEKPMSMRSKEEFAQEVEKHQQQYGEQEFSWEKSTEEMIRIVFQHLGQYVSEGELQDVRSQLPQDLVDLFEVSR